MKVLVHGDSLGAGLERLRNAAAALDGRGHLVFWEGRDEPPQSATPNMAPGSSTGVIRVRGVGELTRTRADIAIGGATRLGRFAAAAWLSGAGATLVGMPSGVAPRWGVIDQWFLGSIRTAWIVGDAPPEPVGVVFEPGAFETHGWPAGEPAPGPDPVHGDAEHLERVCESLRSRRHGPSLRPAVFLDRDGTLVVEKGYLSRSEDLELLPAVPQALRALHAAGFALVVISNQSGVGRGLFPRSSVIEAMARLRRELRRHGVELDAIYFCPHRPDEGCECRKPSPGLVKRAAGEHRLDPKLSAMVGDKLLDVATGQRGGSLGILVRTGYGRDEAQRADASEFGRPPDLIAEDLAQAADWLIARDGAPAGVSASKPAARSGPGWSLTPLS